MSCFYDRTKNQNNFLVLKNELQVFYNSVKYYFSSILAKHILFLNLRLKPRN